MKNQRSTFLESLHTIWIIASKDIMDAMKNRATSVNIIMGIGLIVFFHYMLTVRSFDQYLDIMAYTPEGSFDRWRTADLSDGTSVRVKQADTAESILGGIGYNTLGIIFKADDLSHLAELDRLEVDGYIQWYQRGKFEQLHQQYTSQLSELFALPVEINMAGNIIKPHHMNDGAESTASFHMLFAIFYMASILIPFLILEEKQNKTLQALLISPASHTQIILGKLFAGLFYMIIAAGISITLNAIYVISWGRLALAVFLGLLFSALLALTSGMLMQSQKQFSIWGMVMVVLLVPTFFVGEPNLAPGVNFVLSIFPTSAISILFRSACTVNMPIGSIAINLGIILSFSIILFIIVLKQLKRISR